MRDSKPPTKPRRPEPLERLTCPGATTAWQRVMLAVVLLVTIASLFGAALVGDRRLAFRDVSHFYQPLYSYLAARSADEWFPTWGPLDRFGVPLAGETSTAIFYPPRMVFALPIEFDAALAWFVVLHLLLAGVGAYLAARSWGASATAALTSAVAYPASGAVFFLYTNPPFLVGAAWLPYVLAGLWRFAATPSARSLAAAALPLALCVLGGDPQTALHGVLVACGIWLVRPSSTGHAPHPRASKACSHKHASSVSNRSDPGDPSRPMGRTKGLVMMAAAGATALGIAMPQVWPSAEWSRHSWRRATAPETLFDLSIDSDPPDASAGSGGREHHRHVYDYSLAPWHLIELATPAASGHLAPVNTRWTSILPGEPRMWTPTIYCGLLTFVVLCASVFRPKRWNRWLGVAAIGLTMSLGEFGLGYAGRTALYWVGYAVGPGWSDAAGGPYWMLVTGLPGYGQFRFPVKWLPVAALGMTVFGAIRLSLMERGEARTYVRSATVVGVLALAMLSLLTVQSVAAEIATVIARDSASDRFWGPLEPRLVMTTLRRSLAGTSLVAGCIAACIWLGYRDPWRKGVPRQSALFALVLLTVVEMGIVAGWQSVTTAATPHAVIAEPHSAAPPRRYLVTAADLQPPPIWSHESNPDRAEQVERWMRRRWFVRWHLADGAAVVNNVVSIPSERSERLWSAVRSLLRRLEPRDQRAFLRKLADRLSIDRIGLAAERARPDERAGAAPDRASPLISRIRWHGRWVATPAGANSPTETALPAVASHVERLLRSLQAGEPRVPIVEWTWATSPPSSESIASGNGSIEWIDWSDSEVRCRVRSDRVGLVTMMQLHDGNWTAEVRDDSGGRWRQVPVHRVDVVGQGIFVGPGDHWVRFVYAPYWRAPSILVSLLTVLSLVVAATVASWSKRAPRDARKRMRQSLDGPGLIGFVCHPPKRPRNAL